MSLESPDTSTQLKNTTIQLSQQGTSFINGEMTQGYNNSKISNDIGTTNDKLMIKKQMKDGYYPERGDIIYDEDGYAVVGWGDGGHVFNVTRNDLNFSIENEYNYLKLDVGFEILSISVNNSLSIIYVLRNGVIVKRKDVTIMIFNILLIDNKIYAFNSLSSGYGYYELMNVTNDLEISIVYSGINVGPYWAGSTEFFSKNINSGDLIYYESGYVYFKKRNNSTQSVGNFGRYASDVLFDHDEKNKTGYFIIFNYPDIKEYEYEIIDVSDNYIIQIINTNTITISESPIQYGIKLFIKDNTVYYIREYNNTIYVYKKNKLSQNLPTLFSSFVLDNIYGSYRKSFTDNMALYAYKNNSGNIITLKSIDIFSGTSETKHYDPSDSISIKAISRMMSNNKMLIFNNTKELELKTFPTTTTRLGPCLDYNTDTKEVTMLIEGIDDSHTGLIVNVDYYVDNYGKLTLDVTDQYYGKALRSNRIAWLNQKLIEALGGKFDKTGGNITGAVLFESSLGVTAFFDNYGDNVTANGCIARKSRGTKEIPLPPLNNDLLGVFGARSYNGTNFYSYSNAYLAFYATETHSTTNAGVRASIFVTKTGTNTPFSAIDIENSGNITFNKYVKFGSDAPSIKTKELSGFTGINNSTSRITTISHGISSYTKIIGVSIHVKRSGSNQMFPQSYEDLTSDFAYYFSYNYTDTVINIYLKTSAGANIINQALQILITYKE